MKTSMLLLSGLLLAPVWSSAKPPTAEELWNEAQRRAAEPRESAFDRIVGDAVEAWETVRDTREGYHRRANIEDLERSLGRQVEKVQVDLGASPRYWVEDVPGTTWADVVVLSRRAAPDKLALLARCEQPEGTPPEGLALHALDQEVELGADDAAAFWLGDGRVLIVGWERAQGRDAVLLNIAVWEVRSK